MPWFDECEVTQRKKNRNQMANAHIPKHEFSSQGGDGRKMPEDLFRPSDLVFRVRKVLSQCRYFGLHRLQTGFLSIRFLHFVRVKVASACLLSATQLCLGQPSPSSDPLQEFKEFIQSPPPIRNVIYKHYYPGREDASPPTYTRVTWQSNAFLYIKSRNQSDVINDSNSRTNSNWNARLGGRYDSEWWKIAGEHRELTVWDSKDSPKDHPNSVNVTVGAMFQEFSYLMNMGVQHAGFGNIIWSANAFVVTNIENGIKWSLSGSLMTNAIGRAETLQLRSVSFDPQFTKPRIFDWVIGYEYDSDFSSYIPNKIRTEWVTETGRQVLDEYNILHLEVGGELMPKKWFDPDQFTNQTTVVFTVTNNQELMLIGGRWVERMKPNDPRIVSPNPASKTRTVRIAIYFTLIVLLFLPIYFTWRNVSTTNKNKKCRIKNEKYML